MPTRTRRAFARPVLLFALSLSSLAACGGPALGVHPQTAPGSAMDAPAVASGGAESMEGSAPAPRSMASSASIARSASVPLQPAQRSAAAVRPASPGTTTDTGTEDPARTSVAMIVYTADLQLVVEDVVHTVDRVVQLAVDAGGMLAARGDQTVQVRIPSARFREVLAQLETLGEVAHRDIQAEDVSEQYHDLEVQLANLRAVRERLQDFLAHAANVQQALEVERELERVGAQIDQIEGRVRFLAHRAAFSTVTLTLIRRVHVPDAPRAPVAALPEPALPFPWLDTLGLNTLLQLR